MTENELWFTALGPSGAGKTTMLACMYKKFEEILSGSIIADTGTFTTVKADVSVTHNAQILSTGNFVIRVAEIPLGNDIPSTSEVLRTITEYLT